jgi:hypothetical protein
MPHQHQGDAFVSGQMRIGFHGNTLSHVLHLDLETANSPLVQASPNNRFKSFASLTGTG